jgi:hypothetical protein
MHIKRCARRQNMYIIASLKHALPQNRFFNRFFWVNQESMEIQLNQYTC